MKYVVPIILLVLLFVGCAKIANNSDNTDSRPVVYWTGQTISSTESISSRRIYCSGSITIESGATLTLDYVALTISSETDAQYGIFVNSGGTLNITNNSQLCAGSTAEGYYSFWYQSGSQGLITDSTISDTWTPETGGKSQFDEAGMFLEADNFKIEDSTVTRSKGNGIEVYGADGFQAVNTDFTLNGANGLLLRNSNDISISECTFSANGRDTERTDGCGFIFIVCNGSIFNNNITSNRYAGLEGSGEYDIIIYNNQARSNGHFGIFLHDEILRSTAEVYENTIVANGFSEHSGLCIEGSVKAHVHNNTFYGNYIGLRILNNSLVSSIESNVIQNNSTWGIHIDNSSPTFYGNTVLENQRAVFIQDNNGAPYPIFGDAALSNTGQNDLSRNDLGIQSDATPEVKAENNYWGYTTLAEIQTYNNNDSANKIDVTPWLSSP